MPTNILKSLQNTIKKFRKAKSKKAKVVRGMNPVYSSPRARKLRNLMLTRRQAAQQNIKLGLELKNSIEKFLVGEKKKEKKSRARSKSSRARSKSSRARSKSSRARSKSRRARTKSRRRTHRRSHRR